MEPSAPAQSTPKSSAAAHRQGPHATRLPPRRQRDRRGRPATQLLLPRPPARRHRRPKRRPRRQRRRPRRPPPPPPHPRPERRVRAPARRQAPPLCARPTLVSGAATAQPGQRGARLTAARARAQASPRRVAATRPLKSWRQTRRLPLLCTAGGGWDVFRVRDAAFERARARAWPRGRVKRETTASLVARSPCAALPGHDASQVRVHCFARDLQLVVSSFRRRKSSSSPPRRGPTAAVHRASPQR